MKKLSLVACSAGLLLLAACGTTPPPSGSPPSPEDNQAAQGNPDAARRPMFNQQDLQQFVEEANAAADKTTLTKDQFTAELQILRDAMRAKFQDQNPGGHPPRNGGGLRFFGAGSGSRMGQGSGRTLADRLADATTFIKYTDPSGQEVLLALDADGNVLLKWPMNFPGRGGIPPTGGAAGQPGAGAPPPSPEGQSY